MIKILSNDTIQKIAAGEVVERPLSIIKELVENSIDASSTDIIVEVKNGGKTYIKVSDNGTGIAKEDIELAFTRHATSKINDFEDLYKIFSMGFRGEALASIISVAKVKLVTKTDNENLGNQVIYDNNKLIENKSIGTNTGTTIEVFDLFKYLPARMKFLSSDITEGNKITAIMYTFAIGNPHISFTYIKDNKEVFSTNMNNNIDHNYEILFGRDFVKNSYKIKENSKNYSIEATISNNRYYKGNRSMQFIYVNGRYIENQEITDAIESAYNNLIPNGRFPVFEIKIKVNPDLIDVNIHPNKQKIKFSFSDELLDLIKNSILNILYKKQEEKQIISKEKIDTKISFHKLNDGDSYKRILDEYSPPKSLNDIKIFDNSYEKNNNILTESIKTENIIYEDKDEFKVKDTVIIENNLNDEFKQLSLSIENISFNTTIFNKFLVFDNFEDNSLKIIDINRANIRIQFDKQLKQNHIISQELLESLIIVLNKKDIEIFEQNKTKFEDLGYNIERFGTDSVIIRAIPYFLDEPSTEINFKYLLDNINRENNEDNKLFLRKAISLSNHKKRIFNEDEAISFYQELMNSSNPFTDPNGKTIIYNINEQNFIKFIKE